MRRAAAASLALLVAAAPALADEVVLRNGKTLKGRVTESPRGGVVVEEGRTRLELRPDEVAEIRRTPTARERYAERRRALEAGDAEGWHRLGLWAGFEGLAAESRACQEAALVADPDHAGARRACGWIRVYGRWVAAADAMAAVTGTGNRAPAPLPDRAEAAKAAAARARETRDAERAARKAVNGALRLLASPRAAERSRGEHLFSDLGRERGDPHMVAVAPEIRGWYDSWYAAKAAQALIQVRATVATLKRPIPKFTTSLGGFSSPVTLQLPEVAVVSINTFALVPLGIDE
jgi:hypothetical protein